MNGALSAYVDEFVSLQGEAPVGVFQYVINDFLSVGTGARLQKAMSCLNTGCYRFHILAGVHNLEFVTLLECQGGTRLGRACHPVDSRG